MKVTFNDIEKAVAQENMTISGGDIVVDGLRRNVRVVGEFKDWHSIANIIVKQEKFNIIYLRDIAKVSFEEKERESFAREYGSPVIMLDVKKRGGENLLEASDAIKKIIADSKENDFNLYFNDKLIYSLEDSFDENLSIDEENMICRVE